MTTRSPSPATLNETVSSLDRFVSGRAVIAGKMIGGPHQVVGFQIGAGLHFFAALIFLVLSLVIPGGFGFTFGALGFTLSASLFLALAHRVRKKLAQRAQPPLQLTPEAEQLLRDLVLHMVGWETGFGEDRHRLRRAMFNDNELLSTGRRCRSVLSPEAFSILDGAAVEFQRVIGALDGQRGLGPLADEIRGAAAATMARMLDLAARLNRYPEATATYMAEAEARTNEMRELAAYLDAPASGEHRLTQGEEASPLQPVLERLRAHQEAQAELQQVQGGR